MNWDDCLAQVERLWRRGSGRRGFSACREWFSSIESMGFGTYGGTTW